MSKINQPVSVVIPTREIDDNYLKHVSKMFSHPKTEIIVYENNGEKSLPQIYNQGLNESTNDIIVFMDDDNKHTLYLPPGAFVLLANMRHKIHVYPLLCRQPCV